MSDEDYSAFLKEMADVQPIRQTGRAERKEKTEITPGQRYRRMAAEQLHLQRDANFLVTDFVEMLHRETVLSFRRDGIQHGVFRKLRHGAYPIDATLDLHEMTVEQARQEVFGFIQDCERYAIRSALIVHGKSGRQFDRQPAVIKSYLAKWLTQLPQIMAFHSAQGFHGGTGAVYILLKKSEKQKRKNRESLGLIPSKPEF